MTTLAQTDLLQACVQRTATKLDDEEEHALRIWWNGQRERAGALLTTLVEQGEDAWTRTILEHPAHRHPWYDYLADQASAPEFAAFILETSARYLDDCRAKQSAGHRSAAHSRS